MSILFLDLSDNLLIFAVMVGIVFTSVAAAPETHWKIISPVEVPQVLSRRIFLSTNFSPPLLS